MLAVTLKEMLKINFAVYNILFEKLSDFKSCIEEIHRFNVVIE